MSLLDSADPQPTESAGETSDSHGPSKRSKSDVGGPEDGVQSPAANGTPADQHAPLPGLNGAPVEQQAVLSGAN